VQLEALMRLKNAVKDVEAAVPAANEKAKRAIMRILAAHGLGGTVMVTDGNARELLLRADCAAVASGTATLEAALAGCPTVLVYKVGRILAWFARRMIKGIRHVGLANIIAEKAGIECPMPELLQEDFTAEALAGLLETYLTDEPARKETASKLATAVSLLKCGGDAVGNIVRLIEN
jgi:lipid-A-disaccharide synthase